MFTRKKISVLFFLCVLPLLILTGLITRLQNSRPGTALAAPHIAEGPAIRWTDDFESYTPGSTYTTGFPFSNYSHSGLKDMFVFTDQSVSPNQSLKGHGLSNDCGGSLAHRSLEGSGPFEIEVWVRNGNTVQDFTSCHDFYGGIELSTEPTYLGDHRGLLGFVYEEDVNGNPLHHIYGGALEVDEPYPGETRLLLGNYQLATWYKVKIRYEVINTEDVKLTYWVNDQQVGEQILGVRPYEDELAYVGFFVGEHVAWFDDATVYSVGSSPNLGITKDANSPFVVPGGTITYNLKITNQGPISNATGVNVVDTLPAGVVYQSATTTQGSCQHSSGTVTCALGNMAVNATANVQIVVQAPNILGQITNVATVSGDQPDPINGDNTDDAVVTVTNSFYRIFLPTVFKQ